VLAISIAFLARHRLARGFRDYDISLLAFAWLAPLVARSAAGSIGLPLGLIAVLAVYALTLRHAAVELGIRRQRGGDLARA
jgi:alpha-1,2-mannosyltransferase